jgi:hypothetical protein
MSIGQYDQMLASKQDYNDRIRVEGDEGDALRLAIELGISVLIDNEGGYTGAFFVNPGGEKGPMIKESFEFHGDGTKATLEAICSAAHLYINGAGTEEYPWTP